MRNERYKSLVALLPSEDRSLLEPHLDRVTLQRGDVLTMPGQAIEHVFFPEPPAVVALFRQMEDGRLLKVAGLDGASAVGLIEAAGDGLAITRATVVLAGPGFRLRRGVLEDVLSRSAALRSLAARHNEALTAQVMQNAACNALHTLERRLARWLLAAHDVSLAAAQAGPGDEIPLPLTQDTLSDVLGAQRTTVTAIAAHLKDEGVIGYGKGRIFVLDRARLEATACSCNRIVARLYERALSARDEVAD